MKTFTILWGHSGRYGHEWSSAHEAREWAADVWGTVEAEDAEDAMQQVIAELPSPPDDWCERLDGCTIDMIWRSAPEATADA